MRTLVFCCDLMTMYKYGCMCVILFLCIIVCVISNGGQKLISCFNYVQ